MKNILKVEIFIFIQKIKIFDFYQMIDKMN